MGANHPRDMAKLDPRGLIGRIYVGDNHTLLHTKYISPGPHGFREEDFLIFFFFHYKSMGAKYPRRMADLETRASWFQRRRFLIFFFFHYKSMGAKYPRHMADLDPRA